MWLSMVVLSTVLAADKPKLAVLDVQPIGVEVEKAAALGEAITQELSRRGFFEVISSSDIRTLLGVERQRQLLGCGDSSCTAELSGALGARFVLQSSLTRLGDSLQLSLQMLDSARAQTVARSVRLATDVKQLADVLPWALAEATATPLPPAPSKVLPWTLIGLGATAFAGGGVVAIDGFSRDRALKAELRDVTGVFRTRDVYLEEIEVIARNKAIGLSLVAGGAALLGLGILLYPKDPAGGSLALLPTTNGAVLVGVMP
jgi:TolB-like protein